MKRTLKRELKVLEIVKREAIGISIDGRKNHSPAWCDVGGGAAVSTVARHLRPSGLETGRYLGLSLASIGRIKSVA
jgi:hypothetical protein